MPVSSADIKIFKSSIGASTGGTASATQVTGTSKNNFWEDIADVDRIAGGTRAKKSFLGNDSSTDTMTQPKVWISPDATGFTPSVIGIGFDDADDDTYLQGNMTAFGAAAVASLESSAADTRSATLVGINQATGLCETESVVLTGSTPVLSTKTWTKLFAVNMSAEHGSNTVTIKQGSGGTTRGTIGPNLQVCFLWVAASSEATALIYPDLPPGGRYGIWEKEVWPAGVTASRPADPVLNVKEGA